jgi:predicted phosphate transport protein (TIGR00153 family)
MILRLFPQEVNFFELFEQLAHYAASAAGDFKNIVTEGGINDAAIEKLVDIEHQADDVAHTIIDQLNKTFITPFDREDIHALTKELDDVIDMITAIANRLLVYKLTKTDANLVRFAGLIDEAAQALCRAVKGMHNLKKRHLVTEACVEINRLENAGDTMRDTVLAELFETEKDPIAVIKWKEIYQDAETVLDICEDVAHVVGSILVKQA